MLKNRIMVYFFIIIFMAFPASAGDVLLNKLVLNVTVDDTGSVEEIMQTEIENGGSLPIDGFFITVPVSDLTIDSDQTSGVLINNMNEMKFSEIDVKSQKISGKTNIIINPKTSIASGQKWDGNIGFRVENWANKEGTSLSLSIPVEEPQYIISEKNYVPVIQENIDIRGQVFLPRGFEVESVTPKPFRILMQFGKMVPTWTPMNIRVGDVINVKASYSDVLNRIVDTDDRIREMIKIINISKEKQNIDVSLASDHLKKAEDFNTNQALQSYWEKDYAKALQYNGYANNELNLSKNSISTRDEKAVPAATAEGKETPGFQASILIIIILSCFLIFRIRWHKKNCFVKLSEMFK